MSKVDNGEAAEATTLSNDPRQLNTNNNHDDDDNNKITLLASSSDEATDTIISKRMSKTKREDDLKEVTELLAKAHGGDTEAMYRLAFGYLSGLYGLPEDNEVQAIQWFKKSSDLHYPPSMYAYGSFCVEHENNIGLGSMLIRSAACLGSNSACDCLGKWHLNGKYGFPKDLQKAEYCFKKVVDGSCKYNHLPEEDMENAKKWLAKNKESDD